VCFFKEFFLFCQSVPWVEVNAVRVVKKINNNVAVCLDNRGKELIAFGRGIGFPPTPYELTDLSLIQRTFYDVNPDYLGMMETLPSDVVEFTAEVVDLARATLPYPLTPNLLLTLADHIAFAIKRAREGIYIKMPLAYDLEQTYPQEIGMGRQVLEQIQSRFKIHLHRDEASGIAMAFINARVYAQGDPDVKAQADDEEILDSITAIIEAEMAVTIDRNSFNYARYATHVHYLLDRLHTGAGIDSINADIYADLREEYGSAAACVDKIAAYLAERHGFQVTDEEKLYLILHINRVCANEGL